MGTESELSEQRLDVVLRILRGALRESDAAIEQEVPLGVIEEWKQRALHAAERALDPWRDDAPSTQDPHTLNSRQRAEQELGYRVEFERLITSISTSFISMRLSAIDPAIDHALRAVGEFIKADRCYIYLFSDDNRTAYCTHEWTREPADGRAPFAISCEDFSFSLGALLAGKDVYVPRVDVLPEQARAERAAWHARGSRTVVALPMVSSGRVIGAVGFDWMKAERAWPEDARAMLRILGETITSAMARQRTETALRVSEERLRLALDASRMAAWELDLGTGEVVWSHGIAPLLGLALESFDGKNESFLEHVHPDDRASVAKIFEGRTSNAGARFSLEFRVTRPNGDVRWIEANGDAMRASTGALRRRVGVMVDFTERKQEELERRSLEAQLRQAQKMESVGELAGGIAHDFNNLLLAISGHAEYALAELNTGGPSAHESLHEIRRASERAAILTRQLLTFSRRQHIHRQTMNLNQLVSNMMKMMRRLIRESIALEFTAGAEQATVHADPGQIEQVLMNLCLNASDAMPSGGRIQISTSRLNVDEGDKLYPALKRGRYVAMQVADNGTGMPHDVKERMFEPFFTTKQQGKGTGLGLAMVYGIVSQHNGHIEVDSELGSGTTFRIYFPALAQDTETRTVATSRATIGGTETILVAEDDPVVRRIVTKVLARAGYKVMTAENGEEAIKVFEQGQGSIDLLLLDAVMPVMSGREVHDRLTQKQAKVRILFTSGYSSGTFPADFFEQHNRPLLAKPYSSETLLKKVRELLDSPLKA